MKSIVLISDTHGDLPQDVRNHLSNCDEIWHAGDIGSIQIVDELRKISVSRIVYGNIDSALVRSDTDDYLIFELEQLKVLLTHIAGRPFGYNVRVQQLIETHRPDIIVCGHSHILKVARDKKSGIFHLNPGACGYKGFHHKRTLLKFEMNKGKLQNMNVVDFGLRAAIKNTRSKHS